MVESTTQHYGWTKPEVTKSSSTWGGFLNSDLDSIDALVFANQQGIVPIGAMSMFGGATAPANWLLCQGQSLATTGVYAALFAVLGYAFGGSGPNFNLPNLANVFPMGAGTLAATGGAATVTLDATMIPNHTHTATQPTHTHAASQPAHNHSDQGHTHSASQDPHSHTYTQPVTGTPGFTQGGAFGGITGGTTSISQPAVTVGAGVANLVAAQPAVTVTAASAGAITINPTTGGGAAHTNLPPYLQINFIVRYQ